MRPRMQSSDDTFHATRPNTASVGEAGPGAMGLSNHIGSVHFSGVAVARACAYCHAAWVGWGRARGRGNRDGERDARMGCRGRRAFGEGCGSQGQPGGFIKRRRPHQPRHGDRCVVKVTASIPHHAHRYNGKMNATALPLSRLHEAPASPYLQAIDCIGVRDLPAWRACLASSAFQPRTTAAAILEASTQGWVEGARSAAKIHPSAAIQIAANRPQHLVDLLARSEHPEEAILALAAVAPASSPETCDPTAAQVAKAVASLCPARDPARRGGCCRNTARQSPKFLPAFSASPPRAPRS